MQYTINTLEQIKPILIGFRKSNGLSQKELAEKLGVSQQSYQALEANPHKATLERLFKVFTVLGVKLQFADLSLEQLQVAAEKFSPKKLPNEIANNKDSW